MSEFFKATCEWLLAKAELELYSARLARDDAERALARTGDFTPHAARRILISEFQECEDKEKTLKRVVAELKKGIESS